VIGVPWGEGGSLRGVEMADVERIFTLEEAREALKEILPLTKAHIEHVEPLRRRYEEAKAAGDTCAAERLEAEIGQGIREWMEQVASYGAQVKGAWLVDFDSGDGYNYCWHYGEPDILHYHTYEAGFAGRRPIELLEPYPERPADAR
jgi:hypothetical protein